MDMIEKDKSVQFEIKTSEVVAKYGKDLLPPKDLLKICIVAIAHNEFSNNNFWRLLDSINQQEVANKDAFEVLVVVNNTSKKDGAFIDNQKMLGVMGIIAEAKRSGSTEYSDFANRKELTGLSETEKNILEVAIKNKTNIQAIDASSTEKAINLSQGQNPRGVARDIGGRIAYTRFLDKRGSFIDFIDGDCYLKNDYVSTMLAAIEVGKNQVLIKTVISTNPELPEYIKYSPVNRQNAFYETANYLRNSILNTRLRFLKHPAISGQQIAVSSEIFKRSNGYELNEHQEDWVFAQKVDSLSSVRRAPVVGSLLYMSDRRREGSVDGFSEGRSATGSLDDFNHKVVKQTETIVKGLLERDRQLANNMDYVKARSESFRSENKLRTSYLASAKEVMSKSIDIYIEQYKGKLKSNFVTEAQFLQAVSGLSPEASAWLESNNSFVSTLLSAFEVCKFQEGDFKANIASLFEKNIPEYFGVVIVEEPNYQQVLDQINSKQSGNLNLRDFVHLAAVQFGFENTLKK